MHVLNASIVIPVISGGEGWGGGVPRNNVKNLGET